jgi:tRNA threonylcarbamoyladenosine biosynthesis protein TsaE
LVKGIARGNAADAAPPVTSPTFTLIHEYPGRFKLYHVDSYRLAGSAELEALGFSELIHPGSVVVVEWADRVASSMPADTLWIRLTAKGPSRREVSVGATGPVSEACVEAARELLRF